MPEDLKPDGTLDLNMNTHMPGQAGCLVIGCLLVIALASLKEKKCKACKGEARFVC